MRSEQAQIKWVVPKKEKEAVLSLRPSRRLGYFMASVCTLIVIAIALSHSVGYLDHRFTVTAVGILAIFAGFAASNVFHPILEVRLERGALFVRGPWTARRYLWHDIPEPFYVLAGKSGKRVTFTWYSGGTVKRAFLSPDCLRISAENLAALLNARWERAWRLRTPSAMKVPHNKPVSDAKETASL